MLEIVLVDDVKTLEDVVVTGYSNVRKNSFTGSSTQISGMICAKYHRPM